jgi:hypothetical protein
MIDFYVNGRRANPKNIFRAGVDVEKITYADDQVVCVKSEGELQIKYSYLN